ncbi:MAG TPA: 2-oxoacid:acceptor oxidoreductase subunit alpha [Candidatus Peregrinibacteria bacterium]|nr:2-oxoacid:acceptor oxidoreductase subunit alpha [Candidatus Peregrinibacteria bacterium]
MFLLALFMQQKLVWQIGGEAGYGIMGAGMIMSKVALRQGYWSYDYPEYPSLIRGGHNVYQVVIGNEKVEAQSRGVDVLVALNEETVEQHLEKVNKGGVVLAEEGVKLQKKAGVEFITVPFSQIAVEVGKNPVMKNTVALGASCYLLGLDLKVLKGILKEIYGRKGELIVKENHLVAEAGFKYIPKNFLQIKNHSISASKGYKKGKRIVVSGNEAVALGAIKAGCKFFPAYPMTPASSVMHFMAAQERNYDIVMKHTEDEICAINMAVGGNYAGVRSMTGTSGGGFALMTEALGMAALSETPVVIVESQRAGPSTGMPTWTGQGDLRFVAHASQDDFLRVVLAPGDMEECFYHTFQAFNLADKYQIPVLILIDKLLSESRQAIERFQEKGLKIERGYLWREQKPSTSLRTSRKGKFLRYQLTKDGVSPRAFPGEKGAMHVATSYEHDETGYSSEDIRMRNAMMEKRMKKLPALKKELPKAKLFGSKDAEITVVSWGSCKGPILEALKMLPDGKVNFLQISTMIPFLAEDVAGYLKKAKKIVVVEANQSGQLHGLIREHCLIKADKEILQYDGRPFYAEDLVKAFSG